jgi:hypothetical protein
MISLTLRIAGATVVAMMAAGALTLQGHQTQPPMALEQDGVGPLRLGFDYQDAVVAVQRAAPETNFAGLGCNGFDEVRYSGELAGLPVSVMGMSRASTLDEVTVTVDAPLQTPDEAACLALRDQFAGPFLVRFGRATEDWIEEKPVSREHLLKVGSVLLAARWFPTGRSCYVSALYGNRSATTGW